MRISRLLAVRPGSSVNLDAIDPDSTPGFPKPATKDDGRKELAEDLLKENHRQLAKLQYRLWAERRQSLLLVLQGMDTSGKDGVIRHVITGMNPTGCTVASFKKPSEEENGHDFL